MWVVQINTDNAEKTLNIKPLNVLPKSGIGYISALQSVGRAANQRGSRNNFRIYVIMLFKNKIY